jgi:uncharacterized SAM-binding protein YcdF (DUF218 family)
MFIFLSKLLPVFIYPIGLTLLLVAAALFLQRHRRAQRWLLMGGLLLLWLGSTRTVSLSLIRPLERWYGETAVSPSTTTPADAIVVLGGGTYPALSPRTMPEVGEAGDRLLLAAWLYREGLAERIVLTGGQIAWSEEEATETEVEAHSMAALLTFFGVPEEALLLEAASRNTYENALFTRQLLEDTEVRRILLVTSASHMPRSVRLFEAQGFAVIPAPADFRVTDLEWDLLWTLHPAAQIMNWLPEARYLLITTTALKEYMGLLVYGLRGWL